MDTSFTIDWWALAAAAIFSGAVYLLWLWSSSFAKPYILFSDIKAIIAATKGRAAFALWPRRLMWVALFAFAFAYVDPHLFVRKHPEKPWQHLSERTPPTEGIAIYLLLDQSGSMAEKVLTYTSTGSRRRMTKIELLKQVTEKFIDGDPQEQLPGRPDDMIGVISFARGASVLSPLTLDHEAIIKQLSKFNVVGSKDQDGTAIGYAIFKAVNLIAATRHYAEELIKKKEPAYTIKNSIIVLITDGMQDPNPLDAGKRLRNMDIPGAADYAKEQGVRLYIVNVEPKMALEEFAPNRHQMERAAGITGGKFFVMDHSTSLEQIYQEIDKLEKSRLPVAPQLMNRELRPDLYQRVSFYPYLIDIGLVCLLIAVLLESMVLRRVP